MKKIYINLLQVILLLALVGFQSCDPDFLDKKYEPKQYLANKFYITSIPQEAVLTFNTEEGNTSWRVVQYPNFIELTDKRGATDEYGVSRLAFSVKEHEPNFYYQDNELLIILEVDGIGMLGIPLGYQLVGELDGALELTPTSLSLTDDEWDSFSIYANGDLDINWEIVECPDWLIIDASKSGWLPAGETNHLSYHTSIDNMSPGQYQANVKFKFNGDNYVTMPVSLQVSEAPASPKLFESACIGSAYIEASDLLVVVTKTPNQILFFKDGSLEPDVVDLERVPRSMTLSEDQTTLAISYSNAEITTYNASTAEVKQTYNIDVVAESLAFGSTDYLYYLSSGSSTSSQKYMNSLNLTNNQQTQSSDSEGGYEYLRKVPGKNIIVTSKPGYGPEFLILYYDTHLGTVDKMNEYWVSPRGLWPSDDGTQLLSGSGVVYKVPDYDADLGYGYDMPVPLHGEIELPSSKKMMGMSSSSNLQLIYALLESNNYDGRMNLRIYNKSTFAEVENIDLNVVDVSYSDYWSYRTSGVFPNATGNKIWVVQAFPDREDASKSKWRTLRVDIP
jgi:hypothetical protein